MHKILKNKAVQIIISVLVLILIILFLAKSIRITPTQKSEIKAKKYDESLPSATLTIECTSVYESENYSKLSSALKQDGALPKDGYFANSEQVNFEDGDTVLDVLTDYCGSNNIALDCQLPSENAARAAYVKGIGGLYEFDCTKNSGWVYGVNGDQPSCAMSDYTINNGDEITVSFIVF